MSTNSILPRMREWLRNNPDFSPNTIDVYRRRLTVLDTWLTKTDFDPATLTPDSFRIFLDAQKNWGQNTARLAGYAARSFFRWQYGNSHPLLKLRLARLKAKPRRTLNAKQSRQILTRLNSPDLHDKRNRAILALMLDTALRAFEVCDLLLEYLDLEARTCWAIVKGGGWERRVYSRTLRTLSADG